MEVVLRLRDRKLPEMKDAGREDRIGVALAQDIHHVIECSATATGNNRNTYGITHCPGEFYVISILGSVRVLSSFNLWMLTPGGG